MRFRSSASFILSAAVFGSSCAQAQSDGWTKHAGSSGFVVSTPAGWSAAGAKDGHVLIRSANAQEFAVLQPFDVSPDAKASAIVGSLLNQMSDLFPHPKIVRTESVPGAVDEVVCQVDFGVKSRANVLCFQSGGAGMLYAIAAPEASFSSRRAELIRILGTFRYGGSAARSAGLDYTAYTDPNEGAFSVQVPRGWNASGGLYRVTPLDLRTQIEVASPDGATKAQYGDSKMLPFVPIAGAYAYGGRIHEGMISDNHGPFMFLNFETGAQFSKGYLNLILSKKYQELQIGESKDRPDLQELVEKILAKSPMRFQISTGETDFTFTEDRQPRQGVCIVTTILSAPGTAGQGWKAIPGICTAPADKMGLALSVLGHLAVQKWSQEWAARTNQAAGVFTEQIEADFERNITGSSRELDNILTGSEDVRGASGQTFHVAAGHNYYYLGAGGVVGTNSATPPDIGFTPLTRF